MCLCACADDIHDTHRDDKVCFLIFAVALSSSEMLNRFYLLSWSESEEFIFRIDRKCPLCAFALEQSRFESPRGMLVVLGYFCFGS